MLKQLTADLYGTELGFSFRVSDRTQRAIGPMLKPDISTTDFWHELTKGFLRQSLLERNKDPDFYSFNIESERDASTRSYTFTAVATPKDL